MKRALITGITGQDGYFLSKFLLSKGYEVYGIARRNSQQSLGSLNFLDPEQKDKITIHWGDITDCHFIYNLVKSIEFDEIYHLAAQSFVHLSFTNPKYTFDVNTIGTLNLLEAIRKFSLKTKFYFAGTSEMFGEAEEIPQKETTKFNPKSPYGISKVASYYLVKNYREAYNLFACSGICFNHESEIRGPEFVTRKISLGVAKIAKGFSHIIEIGNLEAKRDWGYADDYVKAMWLMLQQQEPDDYVIATGEQHSVREFIEEAFNVVNIKIVWEGEKEKEIGRDSTTGKVLVKVNQEFYRPADVNSLLGDYSKAKKKLGWEPKIKFKDLVKIMVESDLKFIDGLQNSVD